MPGAVEALLAPPLLIFMLLTGCGDMQGDGTKLKGTAETKSEFLSEFAGRTGATGRGYLNLSNDGGLRYDEQQNPHCTFEYLGRVEVVDMNAQAYSVTYRYTSLNTARYPCRQ